jgi:tripartite-type tricarboxylate transporter receptor subunit TctC
MRAHRPCTSLKSAITRYLSCAVAGAVLSMFSSVAGAQSAEAQFPNKPIKLVVPIAAGGGTDILARAVANQLQKSLGWNMVVENRPGANGLIGSAAVAQAPADGYTILVGSIGTHAANEFFYAKLPYHPEHDFTPITSLARYNNVVVVPRNSEIKTLGQLVEGAKKEPGKLNNGITVIGSSSHLAVELFKSITGLDVTAVPYNGAVAAITGMYGGQTQFMLDTIVSQSSHIESGRVRALATTGDKRDPFLPNVPTIAESGYPGFQALGWTGLFAPAKTPPAIVSKISQAVKTAFESPDIQKQMGTRGVELTAMSPQEFTKFVAAERDKWGGIIKKANLKID